MATDHEDDNSLAERRFGRRNMFVEPDDDPLSTAASVGERGTLTDYLRAYRQTLELKCQGLDAEQMASRSVPRSDLSLLGLVRHMADVERNWFRVLLAGQDAPHHFGDGCADLGFTGVMGDGESGSLCEMLVHMIEGYACHCGHADLIRERIDGRVGQ